MSTWNRIVLTCLSLICLGLAPSGAAIAQVKVTGATPSYAYPGTASLDVVVTGSDFDRSAKVKYLVSGTTDTGGITVLKVTYRSSSQLVTTIAVSSTANLANFDIEVTLDSGRKGKGTTLFQVEAPPTYPAERAWHAFTSNGGADVASSRLYMYGGAGSDWQAVPADLWHYNAYADQWTLVTPASTARPDRRQWEGLSCGAGACVMAAGSNGVGLASDTTWVYVEATNAWTKIACRKGSACLAPRQMLAMAFDRDHGNHLLFGGRGSSGGFNDTLTFDVSTLKWVLRAPTSKPSERNRAAIAHVPGIGVVMHGGQNYRGSAVYCDLFAWNGSDWSGINFDQGQPHPCLHSHDMWWDGTGIVVTGGYVDTSDTPSPKHWRFTLAPDGKSGAWSNTTAGTCQSISGTDTEIHPGARMAYDTPTRTRVYFGGEMNGPGGVVRYGNTVECR